MTLTEDGVSVTLNAPHEVVRLAFAKTPAGAAEIAGWSEGPALELVKAEVLPEAGGGSLAATDPSATEAEPAPEDDDGLFADLGTAVSVLSLLPLLLLGA